MPGLTRNKKLGNGVTIGYTWIDDNKKYVDPSGDLYVEATCFVDQASKDAGDKPVARFRVKLIKANIAASLATFSTAVNTELANNVSTYFGQIS